MEKQTVNDEAIARDVLHIPAESKLTAEEIAKAIAHHKRHHHDEPPAKAGKPASGKKSK